MNVQTTNCLPFMCNQIQEGVDTQCTVCAKSLPCNTFLYPVPQRSSFEVPPTRSQYISLDPRFAVPADNSNGMSHRYKCRGCQSPADAQAAAAVQNNVAPYQYNRSAGIRGKNEFEHGKAWFSNNMRAGPDMRTQHPDPWNYLMGLGEMGAFNKNPSTAKSPMATLYRVYKNQEQKIEFVHLDKFFGLELNHDDADPALRFPLWSSYLNDPVAMAKIFELRQKCYKLIYSPHRIVECDVGPRAAQTTKFFDLEEYERRFIKNFGLHSVLNCEKHATQLDVNHRWWDGNMTYRVIINGEDVGLVEFKLKRTVKKRLLGYLGNQEIVNSLYLYNVAAFKVGFDLTPHCLWFAKNLAMWINKFSDIQAIDKHILQNVYLTTSKKNPAFANAHEAEGFYTVPNADVYWDLHYCWDVPNLFPATPMQLANPPGNIIGVTCNLQLIDEVVNNPNNVIDNTFV